MNRKLTRSFLEAYDIVQGNIKEAGNRGGHIIAWNKENNERYFARFQTKCRVCNHEYLVDTGDYRGSPMRDLITTCPNCKTPAHVKYYESFES